MKENFVNQIKSKLLQNLEELSNQYHDQDNGTKTKFCVLDNLIDEDSVQLIYKQFQGWKQPIDNASSFDDLPLEAQKYINYLSETLNVPFSIISIGPKRNQILNLQSL